jgi:hypothetical protein
MHLTMTKNSSLFFALAFVVVLTLNASPASAGVIGDPTGAIDPTAGSPIEVVIKNTATDDASGTSQSASIGIGTPVDYALILKTVQDMSGAVIPLKSVTLANNQIVDVHEVNKGSRYKFVIQYRNNTVAPVSVKFTDAMTVLYKSATVGNKSLVSDFIVPVSVIFNGANFAANILDTSGTVGANTLVLPAISASPLGDGVSTLELVLDVIL